MSKEKQEVQEVAEDKIDTSIETLKVQVREYREKFNYYQVMVNKAEGALEVLMQLSDKKEEEPTK